MTQVWTLLEGKDWMADSGRCQDAHILEGAPFYLWIPLHESGLHPPSYCMRVQAYPEVVSSGERFPRTGICPVALEYLLCIPFMEM